MPYIEEVWERIKGFRKYEVSNFGSIVNVNSNFYVQPSFTLQGGLKVGLYKGDKQYTRSVKRIVAETFVPGQTATFNTPILLDGNQENCAAHNIMWRPRWHAWHYARQFHHIPDFYSLGPVVELDEDGFVCGVFKDTLEVGMTQGVLFEDVWRSIHTRQPVFPTRQVFTFEDKV